MDPLRPQRADTRPPARTRPTHRRLLIGLRAGVQGDFTVRAARQHRWERERGAARSGARAVPPRPRGGQVRGGVVRNGGRSAGGCVRRPCDGTSRELRR